MSTTEFTQKDLDNALALITELREEINDIKKKTAGRSAWDTGETNFGFNKEA